MIFNDASHVPISPRHPERVLKVIFGLVLVLPVLAWSLAALQMHRAYDAEAREHVMRMADLLHEHALKVFETQDLVATQVEQTLYGLSDAQIVARQGDLRPRFLALTRALAQLQDIWVLDAKGFPLVVTNFAQAPRSLDLSDRSYFSVHRDRAAGHDEVYVSEPLRGRADPTRTFVQLSKAWRHDGNLRGVIALSIEPAYFASFYAQAAEDGVSFLALARADGAVLARDPAAGEPLGRPFHAAIAQDPVRGLYRGGGDGKPEMLVAYRKVATYPVYVLVGFNLALVEQQWRDKIVSHLYFGIPAVIGLLTLILLALRQNRREFTSLLKLQRETLHRRELEAQLHHAQRLESLGRLTGGVAHDFNNLLTVVSGSLELLRKRLPSEAAREHQLIDRALAGVERGSQLNRRLLSFARQQKLEPECVDAHAVVSEVAEMARLSVGGSVEIDIEPGRQPAWVLIDRGQFETALLNLCVNARDAMPDGGRIRIAVSEVHFDAEAARRHGVADGDYCLVRVADTGEGMTPEVLSKAADPFFTTKPPGFGTGLGLSQVHGFITQSGGRLQLDSAIGRGTIIVLYLPSAPPPGPDADEGAPGQPSGC